MIALMFVKWVTEASKNVVENDALPIVLLA